MILLPLAVLEIDGEYASVGVVLGGADWESRAIAMGCLYLPTVGTYARNIDTVGLRDASPIERLTKNGDRSLRSIYTLCGCALHTQYTCGCGYFCLSVCLSGGCTVARQRVGCGLLSRC
jgi:hypothetical protein